MLACERRGPRTLQLYREHLRVHITGAPPDRMALDAITGYSPRVNLPAIAGRAALPRAATAPPSFSFHSGFAKLPCEIFSANGKMRLIDS